MSNTGKLVVCSIFILFVIIIIYDGNNIAKDHCEKEFQSEYFGCLINKTKDLKNHGHVDLYIKDFKSNQVRVLDPGSTGQDWAFYDKVSKGDTIIKHASGGIFYILNGAKRDSIVFSCGD